MQTERATNAVGSNTLDESQKSYNITASNARYNSYERYSTQQANKGIIVSWKNFMQAEGGTNALGINRLHESKNRTILQST